ncbi:MAG: helix-turn-helix transcriptional regulator [Clostridiales bacterium]|nr:helix-turn-helix transcriptional regulator [Clostridiales bacterium]
MKLRSFKDGLKRARKSKKSKNGKPYTQETFAEEFNVSVDTVKNWEQGRVFPSVETIIELCDFFNCDMDYLFGTIDCKTHDLQFIHDKTGLSEKAIETLTDIQYWQKHFPDHQSNKLDTINLILSDEHEPTALSSLLNILTGYFNFNINPDKNTMYTLSKHGIIPCQIHKSASGVGVSYDPSQAHFGLHDLESMYYLKIWDAIKELKEKYRKQIK